MVDLDKSVRGQFCWLDLAAADAAGAKDFYEKLFGWDFHEQPANGGTFTRVLLSGRDIGSMYQLTQAQLARGVPSHWTPYVRVSDVADAARCGSAIGGKVIVHPFTISGIARIALIQDSVGALVGLWETLGTHTARNAHG
jgi:uncharacterized protein